MPMPFTTRETDAWSSSMRRRWIEATCAFLAASALLVSGACDNEPMRPRAVPADAFWVGGSDGGAWIGCRQTQRGPSTFRCVVFSANGEPEADDDFVCRPVSECDLDPADPLAFDAWDGRSVHLRHGRLDPIAPTE